MNKVSRNKIEPTPLPKDLISFSLKYLRSTDKFCYEEKDRQYFCKMLNRLRCHPIDWNDPNITENCFGLPNEEDLVGEPYQFCISGNKYGRVHGFFIASAFHIVWFDPGHKLYFQTS